MTTPLRRRPMRKRVKFLISVAVGITLLLVLGILALLLPAPAIAPPLHLIIQAERFEKVLHFEGTIEASENAGIQAPSGPYERQLSFLAEEGTIVKKGDVVARFDTSSVLKKIEDIAESKQNATDEGESLRQEWGLEQAMLDTDIDKNQTIRDIYALDKKTLVYAQEFLKDMADLQYAKAAGHLTASQSKKTGERNLSSQQIQSNTKQLKNWERKKKKDEKMLLEYEVKAPMDSIVIHRYLWLSHSWKKPEEGEFLPRHVEFMQLPDLGSLVVRLQVEERLVDQLHQGANVDFTPLAAEESRFTGKVEAIATLAIKGQFDQKRKFFEVTVAIDQETPAQLAAIDTLLKPGMIVRAKVHCQTWESVFAIPIEFGAEKEGVLTLRQWQPTTSTIKNIPLTNYATEVDYFLIEAGSAQAQQMTIPSEEFAVVPAEVSLAPKGLIPSLLADLKRNISAMIKPNDTQLP